MLKKAIRICPVCAKLFWVMVNSNEKIVSNYYAKRVYPLQTEVRKKGCFCCSTKCSRTFTRVQAYIYKKQSDARKKEKENEKRNIPPQE